MIVTHIPITYRDAANYKAHGELLIEGELSDRDLRALRDVLIDGLWFDPTSLGLPHLGHELPGFPGDDDHPLHEMDLDESHASNELVPAIDFATVLSLLR